MPDKLIVFQIAHGDGIDDLTVEMSAANAISFTVNFENMDYPTVIADICAVAPAMMNLDSDLQEAYDNAFRTEPKIEDRAKVGWFLQKYRGRIPADLGERFFA